MWRLGRRFFSSFAALLLVVGCASARMSDSKSTELFRQQRYDEAAAHLKEGLADQGENGRDLLLYLLDLGLALHSAGKYEESNQYFLKADKIAEIKDYTSLATESATLLTSDNIKDYKGEDFEKVLINAYLATNYALMGNREDALVEARRVNQKLYLMVTQGARKYQQSAYARYLSAILYEADGNYNDAYVDYKNTFSLFRALPGLGRDLWRMAWVLGMPDDMERWDSEFHLIDEDHQAAKAMGPKSQKGEIIVIYENGISPVKRPNPKFQSIPKFVPRFNPVLYANVELDGRQSEPTASVENIEEKAIENLDEKYAAIIAKKVAGVVAKEVVARQIEKRTDSPLLGVLARVALYASDTADLRSWNLLPHDFQIARIPVDPGKHVVKLNLVGAALTPEKTIEIRSKEKVFVDFRYMP